MFTHNQKVVPVRKTVGVNLEDSAVWNKAKKQGQKFLYFKGRHEAYGPNYVKCNVDETSTSGDLFHQDDLIPYEEQPCANILEQIGLKMNGDQLKEIVQSGFIKDSDIYLVKRLS